MAASSDGHAGSEQLSSLFLELQALQDLASRIKGPEYNNDGDEHDENDVEQDAAGAGPTMHTTSHQKWAPYNADIT